MASELTPALGSSLTITPKPFASWAGPRDARVVFVGEAWGESEDLMRQPFVGYSGQEFWRLLGTAWPNEGLLWGEAERAQQAPGGELAWVRKRGPWLEAQGFAFTNVFNFRPPANKLEYLCSPKAVLAKDYDEPPLSTGKYLNPEHLPERQRLHAELAWAPRTLIVALGNTACWALLGRTDISNIRGTVFPSPWGKILPTFHPAYVLRQWSDRVVVVADLMKAKLEAEYPDIRRPQRKVLVNPTIGEVMEYTGKIIADALAGEKTISSDVETDGGQITVASFSADETFAMVVPFVDWGKPSGSYWQDARDEVRAWQCAKAMLEDPRLEVLGQNFVYDMQYFLKVGIRPRARKDTMLLHHAMYPELRKGLGFLGSIYTLEPAWKLMRRKKRDTTKRDE